MVKKRKIATNIPDELLREATRLSGLNQTAAIVQGLTELVRQEKIRRLVGMRGKLSFDYDIDVVRNRIRL